MKVAVILPAAGLGTRMGRTSAETAGTSRKQFMQLDGSPILLHTVRKFAASNRVGQIVVALTDDGEATLKRWYPEKNRICLKPANSKMKPIYVKNAKVLGVVVGVVRKVG